MSGLGAATSIRTPQADFPAVNNHARPHTNPAGNGSVRIMRPRSMAGSQVQSRPSYSRLSARAPIARIPATRVPVTDTRLASNSRVAMMTRRYATPLAAPSGSTTVVSKPRVFFCNGMNNSRQDALKFCRLFQEKLGIQPELIYNDATTPGRTNKIAKFTLGTTLLNVAGATLALAVFPPAALAFAGTTIASGVCVGEELHQIQHDKMDVSREMAQKVGLYLRSNPGARAVLVAHSQGVHVTDMALEQLRDVRHRIRVITLGGMVSICGKRAERVFNLINRGDSVAGKLAPAYVGMLGSRNSQCPGSACAPCATKHLGHDARDYLNSETFQ